MKENTDRGTPFSIYPQEYLNIFVGRNVSMELRGFAHHVLCYLHNHDGTLKPNSDENLVSNLNYIDIIKYLPFNEVECKTEKDGHELNLKRMQSLIKKGILALTLKGRIYFTAQISARSVLCEDGEWRAPDHG